jgi:hypothetical protein
MSEPNHEADINDIIDKMSDCIQGHDATNAAMATAVIMAHLMFTERISPMQAIQWIGSIYGQIEESEASTLH